MTRKSQWCVGFFLVLSAGLMLWGIPLVGIGINMWADKDFAGDAGRFVLGTWWYWPGVVSIAVGVGSWMAAFWEKPR